MQPRRGDWVQLVSGKPFWPLDPRPEEIEIEDIGHSLAIQARFMGHTRVHYAIASHCLFVSSLVPPQDALWGLLHDASEAYLVDLPRPLKQLPEFSQYRAIEANLMRVVCEKFGLDPMQPESVTQADVVALMTEGRDLLVPPTIPWSVSAKPSERCIVPVPPEQAERDFMAAFRHLYKRSV